MKKIKFKIIAGGVTAPKCFLASGVKAGIKKSKKDMALIYSEAPANAAAVYTTNKVKAAPVMLNMQNLKDGNAQAIIANSGNANACTGEQGMKNALAMTDKTGQLLAVAPEDVIVISTGVIGVQLPMAKIERGIARAVKSLSSNGGLDAAEAIMTTDTVPKSLAITCRIGDKKITLGATAKGSGMIHPNMATMLCFITTDAAISASLLDKALKKAVNLSFNMITIDGDTSTNDMVAVLANGFAGNKEIIEENEEYELFTEALTFVCSQMAQEIVKDGEGATKLVEINVENALTEEDAKKAAIAVATSNLVKTAVFGEDANWGRIICAVGYSGADINPDTIDIFLGPEKMAENGCARRFSEAKAKKILQHDKVAITIDLKQGTQHATAWTCDFSYDYVKINASYRT